MSRVNGTSKTSMKEPQWIQLLYMPHIKLYINYSLSSMILELLFSVQGFYSSAFDTVPVLDVHGYITYFIL